MEENTKLPISDLTDKNGNRILRWTDNSSIGKTEYLSARLSDLCYRAHFHETFLIGAIESGGLRFRPWRQPHFVVPKGKLFVVSPGTVHEGRAATDDVWQYRMFYPSISLIEYAVQDCGLEGTHSLRSFDFYVLNDHKLYELFLQLHLASRRFDSLLTRETRTVQFLQMLFSRYGALDSKLEALSAPEAVETIRSYIHAHWKEPVSIDDLVQETGLSPAHVVRTFSSTIGLAPHAYQLGLRVERAKRLILEGVPLVDAALAAAFYDQSQMNRHFKNFVGVTPGQYAIRTV